MDDIDKILENIDKEDMAAPPPSPEADEEHIESDLIPDEAAHEQPISDEEPPPTMQEEPSPASSKDIDDSSIPNLHLFTPRGTKPWNRREPYLIKIHETHLAAETENLSSSFYFLDGPADREALQQRLRQEIVAYLRRPGTNVTDRYREFISKSISESLHSVASQFPLSDESIPLFYFHIGPLTIYKIVRYGFLSRQYGYCYRYTPDNRATRFFPEEFIKYTVLRWFDENIQTLDLPFDSIQKYDEIKQAVAQKYQGDLKLFNLRLEQINARAGEGRSISRARLLQAKGNEWFGQPVIEVYRRFLGSQVFM